MQRTKSKRTGDCRGCNRKSIKKSEFTRKTISGTTVYTCPWCGYYCSPGIFEEQVKVPARKLVFGYPITR